MKSIRKIRLLPDGVKASVAFAVCSILQKGIQLFTVPIFTRTMSTAQYGQYNVFQSWYSIICIFATLNLSGGGFNNGMMKYPEDRDEYISSMQGLSTIVTCLTFVVYMVAQPFWNGLFKLSSVVMYSMFLFLLFAPSVTFWSAKQRYEYKYVALVIFTLLFSVLDPVVGVLAVSATDEKGLARILSVCFVNAAAGLFFYLLNFARGKKVYNKVYWIFALRFNVPLIPHYLSQIILGQSDRIMIERMVGTSSVAVYSVAYNIGMIMSIFVTSINASFVPWTFEALKNGKTGAIRKLSNGLVLMMGIIAVVPIMLAPEAVRILGTEEYVEAVWVIPPVAISAFLTFIYSLFGNIEFYYEKSKFVMVATVTAAASNVILNYVCIKQFGYIAAGFTTLACYGIMVLMHYLFMRKVCREKNTGEVYDLKFVMMILGIVTAVSPVFMYYYHTFFIRYFLILVVCIAVIVKRQYFVELLRQMRTKE